MIDQIAYSELESKCDDFERKAGDYREAIECALVNLERVWELNQPSCPADVQGVIEDLQYALGKRATPGPANDFERLAKLINDGFNSLSRLIKLR